MNSILNTHNRLASIATPDDRPLPAARIFLLASIAGLAVATLYYSQPMLGVIGTGLHAESGQLGMVPMFTQLGYAVGIFFLAPLGDRFDRRTIIIAKAIALTAALVTSAWAPSIGVLILASFAVGLTATLAQDAVSATAVLAPESHRGKVVGTVMTGLLLGILLSRVVSGIVAEHLGWRIMFLGAAATTAALAALAWQGLPRIRSSTSLAYGALMTSLRDLWRAHPQLRRATLTQAVLAVGFSAFWASLALMLQRPPFHLGSAVAGAFGLAGAAGALIAPVAGRLADRWGAPVVARLGTAMATLSFASLTFAPLLAPHAQLWLLGFAVVGFDLGVQATMIAHQTIVYSLEPAARSRLNAILFVGMFIGMAMGAGLSSILLATWGWLAVTLLATIASGGAFLLRGRISAEARR